MEVKKPISHVVAGSIVALVLIIFSVISSVAAGGAGNPGSGWLSFTLNIVCLIIFIQLYAKANHYRLRFKDLFHYGFKTTTMVTLVFVVFLFIFSFIKPQLKQQTMEATRAALENQGNLPADGITKIMQMANQNFWMLLIGSTMFFFVFIGAIGSLLGAAITKKNPQESLPQDNLSQPQ